MSISKKAFTVKQIISQSPLTISESRLLLAYLSNIKLEKLLSRPETKLKPAVYRDFKKLEKKRLSGWPIAYLVGNKEFYGYPFKVSPAVLVPRPETEMIVDLATELFQTKPYDAIIDIGTGSGAIIITLARELKRLFPTIIKRVGLSASDISAPALKIARENAAQNKVSRNIIFKRGNLLKPFLSHLKKSNYERLLITANLPYLTPRQIAASASIQKEPKLALDGGLDGLDLYRGLFKQVAEINASVKLTMILEIDPSQSRQIVKLASQYIPSSASKILKDLAGKKRFALIQG